MEDKVTLAAWKMLMNNNILCPSQPPTTNHSPGALLSRCHWYWESNPHLVAISSSFAVLFLPSTRAGKLVRGRNRVWEYLAMS